MIEVSTWGVVGLEVGDRGDQVTCFVTGVSGGLCACHHEGTLEEEYAGDQKETAQ